MIEFSKYHGCGNDFVIVNKKNIDKRDYKNSAVRWCNRTTGVGADGLIIVKEDPNLEMIIYNSDGSLAPMCGNGIRCFAHYCHDQGIMKEKKYPVITGAGIMIVDIISKDPFITEINMGKPDLDPKVSSIDTDLPSFINTRIEIDGIKIPVGTLFMGTIHTVVWDEDISFPDKISFGKKLSEHSVFKEKTNVNMVEVLDRETIRLVTYERGAGLTAACGTGACASVVYGIMKKRLDKKVRVLLPNGELTITEKEDGTVFMQGPSEKIAEGLLFIEN